MQSISYIFHTSFDYFKNVNLKKMLLITTIYASQCFHHYDTIWASIFYLVSRNCFKFSSPLNLFTSMYLPCVTFATVSECLACTSLQRLHFGFHIVDGLASLYRFFPALKVVVTHRFKFLNANLGRSVSEIQNYFILFH